MATDLLWSDTARALFGEAGRFDGWAFAWEPGVAPGDARPVAAVDGLRRLMSGRARRIPIGVIGPRDASADQLELAEQLGTALAETGLQLLCGGRGGVMEAACKGALSAGGSPIGLLPDTEWDAANPYVAIPIATGIGQARNALIARACLVLVAVGGGYGTLSEMAFGLHFERLVLTLDKAPPVEGTVACASVSEVLERIAARLLRSPDGAVS
ncbi:lysine decarboxylase [Allostella sp. ATCC 35155]|nr:lysine decarboxylase [Stella sp. ATCC 35155]